MLLEDFGQRMDLMRGVLANYPEGTTALRELIQNADDVGASRVRLCLDRRSDGSASLLAQWQGPAYNDAAFTDEDFASISCIGDSKKVSHAWKTGRFCRTKTPEGWAIHIYSNTTVRPSAGQSLYRFPVETACGETHMLLSSHRYSFKSVSMADLSSAPFQLDGGIYSSTSWTISSINSRTGLSDDMDAGHEYGKVSSTQLLQAVRDTVNKIQQSQH